MKSMSQLTDHVLAHVDIVDIVSRYVKLKKTGSNFSGLSPFQAEKTPSFVVSPQKQIFKDFSSGIGGNVITFMMEIEKVDFLDAVKMIADYARIDISQYLKNPEQAAVYADEKEKIKRLHLLAQEFFVDHRQKNDIAKQYIADKRKLDIHTVDTFGVGYAPDSHYDLIQHLKKHGFTDQDILDASLAKKGQSGDIYSFFRHRITFPIRDTMYNIIGFGGRVINPEDKPKYLNSGDHKAYDKSKVLYGLDVVKQYVKEHNKIIVVEGYMDVIGLYRLGYPVGVATCGTAVSSHHIKLLKRYNDNIYFLFDHDQAGLQASIRGLKLAYEQDVFPKILELPDGYKDIDELANVPDGKEIFTTCIANAKDGFVVIFDTLKKKEDWTSPIGKQKVLNALFDIIMHIDSINIQTHYLHILAESLGIAYEVLHPQYKKFAKNEGKINRQQTITVQKAYEPNRDTIVAGLAYTQFLASIHGSEPIQIFLHTIGSLLPDIPLGLVIHNTLDEDLIKHLDEAHLWWSKHLDECASDEKKLLFIKQTIGKIILEYTKQINKISHITGEQKASLMKQMSQLWK